jgi:hypothetical protein
MFKQDDPALSIADAADLIGDGGEDRPFEDRDGEEGDNDSAADDDQADASDDQNADDADTGGDDDASTATPAFWTAEDKAWFAEQPPEVRARILGYEKNRDQATSRALRGFAEARKGAEVQAHQLASLRGGVGQALAQAQARHAASGWEGIDWARWARENPAQALQGKIQHEQEQGELQRLHTARQVADDQAFKAYVREEGQRLVQTAPELANDTAKRQEVGRWLLDQGYPPETLRGVGALDLAVAHKAMQWDRADTALKSKAGARNSDGSVRGRTVRATAAASTPTPKRKAQEASSRFASSRSKDDAVALLNLRGPG